MNRIVLSTLLTAAIVALPLAGRGAEEKVIRLGMIGLDTSHVIAFTGYINSRSDELGCRVVAGYPGGSPDFPASADRVEKFTNQLRDKHGLEIVDSIEELLEKVDGILLESVDGRPHLEQAKPVIAAGKPSGYGPLLEQIVKFFKTGKPPVPAEETIEIFAFMSAADESKAQDGAAINIQELIEQAKGNP